MIPSTHRQVRLAARPAGYPKESDFRLVESSMPEPATGEFLVRVVYLSLDPYMRGRMSDARSYVPPVALGDVMEGGTVGEVVRSNHRGFAVGDVIEGRLGWQEYAVSAGKGVRKIDPTVAPISTALGVLGMPGLTAYFGLLEVGQPNSGETVVVSAASGAVGGLVGQIAKLKGCRAVGLAGSDAKVDYLTRELGYDAGINYRTVPDLDAALRAACPSGVDVYFDDVGGRIYHLRDRAIEEDVLPHCERKRVAVVGYTPLARGGYMRGTVAEIAKRHGRTPRQVALNFLTRRPALFTIPKATDPAHVRENAGALDFTLAREEVRAIDGAA